jgi:predicted nucleic acid-binding Zn ribbon protein
VADTGGPGSGQPSPNDRRLRLPGIRGEVVNRGSRPPPRRTHDDDEGPIPQDLERFSGVTRHCPNCGGESYDDVTFCPHCQTDMDAALRNRRRRVPPWVMITAFVVLVLMIFSMIRWVP